VITQHLTLDLDGVVWTCPGCRAILTEEGLNHHDQCPEIPAGREADLISKLRAQIRQMQVAAERRNRDLDALHLVWCDGGCSSGVHRWSDGKITEELVQAAERNTQRLRRWYNAVKWRLEHYTAGQATDLGAYRFVASEWHQEYARRNAAKTDLLGEGTDDG
jgi:hypothetical protein